LRRMPEDQWRVVIPDHHPGYITRDQFFTNRKRLCRRLSASLPSRARLSKDGSSPCSVIFARDSIVWLRCRLRAFDRLRALWRSEGRPGGTGAPFGRTEEQAQERGDC
jgi:hypothetical protein